MQQVIQPVSRTRKTLISSRWLRWLTTLVSGVLAALFFLFLAVPIISLFLQQSPGVLWQAVVSTQAAQALIVSLVTTAASTLLSVTFGLPVAYILARKRFPGRQFLEVLVTMPTILPSVVAGVALLLTFGRSGFLGHYLVAYGISLPFTTVAVIIAQTFISSPFFVNTAKAGIEQLDMRYERAAYTLGASPFYTFRKVVLPMILPALLTGTSLAWARSLGEFGATITFAGNFVGSTQTLPIAVYIASEDNLNTAIALSVVLIALSFGILLASQLARSWIRAS